MKGLDYSSGRPDLTAAKQAGYLFMARYLSDPVPGGKGISKAEANAILAAGLGLVVVYEWYAGRALEGQAAGAIDGKAALAFARAIGFPESKPIYFAVDIPATSAQQPAIDAYLRGAASIIGAARIGVYGSYYVVERCFTNKTAQWFWQTRGWSNGRISSHTHFYQYLNGQTVGGASVDLNESKQDDFGAWEVEVTKPIPVVTKPVVAPLSTAMQWCINQGIFDKGTSPTKSLDANFLAWSLYRAKGKI